MAEFRDKTYSGAVIARMLGEDDDAIEKFAEDYEDSKVRKGAIEVTPQLQKMAQEYRRGMSPARLMKDYGVNDYSTFYRIVALASRDNA